MHLLIHPQMPAVAVNGLGQSRTWESNLGLRHTWQEASALSRPQFLHSLCYQNLELGA